MAMVMIRPIDLLVCPYYKGSMEVIEADICTPPINSKALAVYSRLKRFQEEAQAMGYDLDTESATQIEADSGANS